MGFLGLVIYGIVIGLILVMAIFLLNGKGAFLLAGYNNMSKEEKANYDEKAMCRFAGRIMLIIAFCMALFPLTAYSGMTWLQYCALGLLLVSIIGAVIYSNTGNRFRINDIGTGAVKKTSTTVTVSITAVILSAVGFLFYYGNKDPVIDINENKVQIKCMYGLNIDYTEITGITLIEKSMRDIGIPRRTNGYGGIGEALKGNFSSRELGDVLLFVQANASPTIHITRSGIRDIYISFRNNEATVNVYNEMVTAIPVNSNAMSNTDISDLIGINVDITTDNATWKGKDCILQTAVIDLDGDGSDERITVNFTNENMIAVEGEASVEYYDTCEVIIMNAGGAICSTVWNYENIKPQINFADFYTRDTLIQFYFEGDGPSADPFTQVFSFDGMKTVKNTGFPGNITGYDGLGRIYSYGNYNVNSYYDLVNGLTPLPKENIVGTEIQRDYNILLCATAGSGYTAAILSKYYESNLEAYIEPFRDNFICIVPANTPLTVIDIEFVNNPWDYNSNELYHVPWINIRTPDGTEGWFCVVYGD